MHRPYCKSLVILTSYPPQYQKCNCGEDDVPKGWPKDLREQAKDKYEEFKNRMKHYPECDEGIATGCICPALKMLEDRLENLHHHEINELQWTVGVTRDDSFKAGYEQGKNDAEVDVRKTAIDAVAAARASSHQQGYEKGLKDCYHILLNKNFMTDDGRWTLAVDSIKECMNEIDKLFGE